MVVQIQVSDETWKELASRKDRPGLTFDEIIAELISQEKQHEKN